MIGIIQNFIKGELYTRNIDKVKSNQQWWYEKIGLYLNY